MPSNIVVLAYLNFLLLFIALCLLVFTAHKVRRIHLKLYDLDALSEQRINNLFSQIEALAAIQHDLALPLSLSATRGWAASPDFLRHIVRVAMDTLPLNVVECSSGASTVVLARVMQKNGVGHVFSLEHDPFYARKTRLEISRQGLDSFATVIDAPLRSHRVNGAEWNWYETKDLPSAIDLLVIDGPPASTQSLARYPAIPVLDARIGREACVMLDDADRPDEQAALGRWASEFGWITDEVLNAEKGIAMLKRSTANRR